LKSIILVVNHSLLFLCISMYFGTGWSLMLFSFPVASQLTVDNYYLQFVPQVQAATRFFTYMTMAMTFFSVVMIVSEWKTGLRWVPVVVLLAVVAATGLTVRWILPLNAVMAAGIRDPAVLTDTLGRWLTLNRIRVAMWTVQWIAMMIYFAIRLRPAPSAA
jgi:hypothetical protein